MENENILSLFKKDYETLMDSSKYIAKSDYNDIKARYNEYADSIDIYSRLEFDIDLHNERFVKAKLAEYKEYFDNLLSCIDSSIVLDEEQRRAILVDEDYCLVIAGAGAGKTTTMAAKVKYLVEKLKINPEDIILISFTNKAVDELKERIIDKLGIPARVTTFHAFGYDILRKIKEQPPGVNINAYNIIFNLFENTIYKNNSLLKKLILFFGYYFDIHEDALSFESLEQFHAYKVEQEYETLRSSLGEYNVNVIDRRSKQVRTIRGEYLRSVQEVQIANFLYLNSIDYEYEKPYLYPVKTSRKPYTPDFWVSQGDNTCYIEHFGITEDGKSSIYNPKQLSRYIEGIEFKKQLHAKNQTPLITTYSAYRDGKQLLKHLEEELIKEGFVLKPRDPGEVYQKLANSGKDKYIVRFILLMIEFIRAFKTTGYDRGTFLWLKKRTDNVRTQLFLSIAEEIYDMYQEELEKNNSIDFEDMINEAEKTLQEMQETGTNISCKYIIIDEYQDIARQRFNLTKRLADITGAKVIAVGDDWQSIFAFSGSDITLFTKFLKLMGYGRELQITHTYRNSQELIDIAGGFVQKNPSQIRKRLISSKHIEKPVILKTYDDTKELRTNRINAVVEAIGEIMAQSNVTQPKITLSNMNQPNLNQEKAAQTNVTQRNMTQAKVTQTNVAQRNMTRLNETLTNITKSNITQSDGKISILLIGRYNFDEYYLLKSESFIQLPNGKLKCNKYPQADITYMTAHSSKGLGYDYVILINALEGKYGFPSQIEDDPVMKLVTVEDRSMSFAEERRLFYVALTRTKNRIYIVTPESKPSRFVQELIRDWGVERPPKLKMNAYNNENINNITDSKSNRCPICEFPLTHKYNKNIGLELWICTNEPEICDFMTNDKSTIGDIFKCPACMDGYMIVKKNKDNDNKFFGCTNHRPDGAGCNHIEYISEISNIKVKKLFV
ncbi:MAG TPA: UvrD-helicase domain-containing protein [Clostridiales bacterium]|nr:UvrD-helicase domain-containing protein [Clostridiales bacterium]